MTDSKIPGLLEKLLEMDQETWIEIDKHDRVYFRDSCMWWYAIQGVIQDAIAANDNFIGFEIIYTSYFDVKYEAEIFWDQTGEILRGFGETAAEALLEAYIAALEAMR